MRANIELKSLSPSPYYQDSLHEIWKSNHEKDLTDYECAVPMAYGQKQRARGE